MSGDKQEIYSLYSKSNFLVQVCPTVSYSFNQGPVSLLAVLGSLSALNALESAATSRQKEQATVTSRSQTLGVQEKKIQELRRKRDELLQQLQNASIEREQDTQARSETLTPELSKALAYISELEEKLNVYKLNGVSLVKTSADSKVLCFSTSYKGVYSESYHLKLQRLSSGRFKVVQHDLPPFVVCSALPVSLEVKDMLSTVRPVQERLSMFVLRREELNHAQAQFPDLCHVMESSAALDFVCFHLAVSPQLKVEITLKYADLTHYLPSSVSAMPLKKGRDPPSRGFPKDVVHRLQTVFGDNPLRNAVPLAADILTDFFTNRS